MIAACDDGVRLPPPESDAGPPDSSWPPYCLSDTTYCRPIEGTEGQYCGPCPYLWYCDATRVGYCAHY